MNKAFDIWGEFEKCPVCGNENVHIEKVAKNDTLDGALMESKNGNVAVHLSGECDHRWIRIFSEHKGNVSKGVVVQDVKYRCVEGRN